MSATAILVWLAALAGEATVTPTYIAVATTLVAGDDYGFREHDIERGLAEVSGRRMSVRLLMDPELAAAAGNPASRLRDCGADAVCVGNVLSEPTVSAALMLVVNARVSPRLVAARVIAAGPGGEVLAEIVGAETPDDGDLGAAVARCVSTVLDELGHHRWARVIVRAEPNDAELSVELPAAWHRESPMSLLLPEGPARLRVSADEHVSAELELELAMGEDREVAVALESSRAWWMSPWLWAAVGVGVVGGVTAASVAALDSPSRCVCVGHPTSPCGCM